MDRAPQSRRGAARVGRLTRTREAARASGRAGYLAAPAAAYFLRNLSTRPAVSTIFCLPV
jgi:hypothetical protein